MNSVSTIPDRNSRDSLNRYFILYLLILVVFSFLLREKYFNLFDFKDRIRYNAEGDFPFVYLYVGDAWNYHDIALNIAQGKGYGFPYYPPIFPYTLSILYRLTAPEGYLDSPRANMEVYNFKCYRPTHRILNIVNALSLVAAGLLFLYLYGFRIACLAVFFCAFSFGLYMMSGSFNSESIYIPLYLLTIGACIFAYRKQTIYSAILSGILCGILVLARAETLGFAMFSILYFMFGWKKRLIKRFLFLSMFLLFFLLPMIVWGIRNYTEFNEFTMISKNGPVNFAIGNNPLATGGYSEKIFKGGHGIGNLNPRNPQHYQILTKGYSKGLEFWREQPERAMEIEKLKFAIFAEALGLGFLPTNVPSGLNGFRNLGDSFFPSNAPTKYIFGILVLIGLFIGIFKRRPGWLFPYIFLLNIVLINLVYFGLTRLGTVMLPIFYMYAALPIAYLLFFLPDKPKLVSFIFIGLSTIMLLLGFWTSRTQIMLDTIDEVFQDARQAMQSDQVLKAIDEYEKAFEKSKTLPYMVNDYYGLAVAHSNMGSLLVKTRKYGDAEKQYLLALKYDPTHPETAVNLAYLYKDYLNNPGQAIRFFQLFLDLHPAQGDAQHAQVELLKLKLSRKN